MFGDRAMEGFKADEINVDFVVRDDASPSGVALIFVGANGENSIGVASGANGHLSPQDVLRAKGAFQQAAVLVMQLETPLETVNAAARLGTEAGLRVILNPAPAQPLPDDLLARLFLLTPNESEAQLLTGVAVTDEASAEEAAGILRKRGVRNVIITMGARGALVSGRDGSGFVPGHKVNAVDTTAAGDVFNGALAVALAEGKTLMDAAAFGSAAAAVSVTRMGAQSSVPTRADIEGLINRR